MAWKLNGLSQLWKFSRHRIYAKANSNLGDVQDALGKLIRLTLFTVRYALFEMDIFRIAIYSRYNLRKFNYFSFSTL